MHALLKYRSMGENNHYLVEQRHHFSEAERATVLVVLRASIPAGEGVILPPRLMYLQIGNCESGDGGVISRPLNRRLFTCGLAGFVLHHSMGYPGERRRHPSTSSYAQTLKRVRGYIPASTIP